MEVGCKCDFEFFGRKSKKGNCFINLYIINKKDKNWTICLESSYF